MGPEDEESADKGHLRVRYEDVGHTDTGQKERNLGLHRIVVNLLLQCNISEVSCEVVQLL